MGIIFNIQKFSIHDGPGIRTTVFFKGCPLHCPWCSNIESQEKQIQLIWDHKRCVGCDRCIDLGLEKELHFIDSENFTNPLKKRLSLCTTTEKNAKQYKSVCPTSALSYEGYIKDAQAIMDEVLKDKVFYEKSGGGLTLSGGEVLMQVDFACELLALAKKNGIHTASETTCFTTHENFVKFTKNLDLLLCDIKHWDSKKHQQVVGVDLEMISENIKYAVSLPKLEVIGRIPVIPGFNYSIEDAHQLSKRLIDFGIQKVNLLPYHNFGENKYRLLTQVYPCHMLSNLHKDDPGFIKYSQVFSSYGLMLE